MTISGGRRSIAWFRESTRYTVRLYPRRTLDDILPSQVLRLHSPDHLKSSDTGKMLDQLSAQRTQRNLQLDVLRAAAILLVLVCHSRYLREPTWDLILWRPAWSGVDLFFVISGFLISGLLFSEYRRNRQVGFARFFVRRAFKIYPAFYAAVILTALPALIFAHGDYSRIWPPLLNDLFFLQSYREGSWGHFWSLSVEEHFYLLLPIALWLMIRFGKNTSNPFQRLPLAFLVVASGVLMARLWTAEFVRPFQWQTHLYPTHLRVDSLLFGVLLAYYFHFHRESFSKFISDNRTIITFVGCLLLSPLLLIGQYDRWMYTWGFTVIFLGYGCLMMAFLHLDVASGSRSINALLGAVAYIGTFSYSIYLWHIPWLKFVRALPLESVGVRLLWFYGGSIIVGIIAGEVIELPALRLREAFFPRITPAFTAPLEEAVVPVSQP